MWRVRAYLTDRPDERYWKGGHDDEYILGEAATGKKRLLDDSLLKKRLPVRYLDVHLTSSSLLHNFSATFLVSPKDWYQESGLYLMDTYFRDFGQFNDISKWILEGTV